MTTNRRLSTNEKNDLVATLEHIVTVGCSKRDDMNRHREASSIIQQPIGKRLRHAEDVRLYETFTEQKKRKDPYWEYEYGDDMDLYMFYERSKQPTNRKARVTREILLRCWERAVQAASNQIIISIDKEVTDTINEHDNVRSEVPVMTEPSTLDKENLKSSDSHHCLDSDNEEISHIEETSENTFNHHNTKNQYSLTPNDAIRRCHELNIAAVDTVCSRCNLTFDSVQQCQQHFHGTETVLGCCWPLVEKREQTLIRTLLDAEVVAVTDRILGRLLQKIKPNEQIEWQQVMSSLNGKNSDPLLSPQIIENIKRRLLQRYANLPL